MIYTRSEDNKQKDIKFTINFYKGKYFIFENFIIY